jgi:hypothetical protein
MIQPSGCLELAHRVAGFRMKKLVSLFWPTAWVLFAALVFMPDASAAQFTEINVNGRRATAAELKPGMTVTAVLGTDPTKASRINAMEK